MEKMVFYLISQYELLWKCLILLLDFIRVQQKDFFITVVRIKASQREIISRAFYVNCQMEFRIIINYAPLFRLDNNLDIDYRYMRRKIRIDSMQNSICN